MAVRFEGTIPAGVVATTSMMRGTRELIEPGAFQESLDAGADVMLLNGVGYADSIATVGTGTLEVSDGPEGVKFRTTKRLPDTDAARDAVVRVRSGLTGGVAPGYVPIDVEDIEVDGNPVRLVRRAMLCEIRLVSRATGSGARISARGSGFRSFFGGGRRR